MKAITIIKRSLLSLAVVPVILLAGGAKASAAQIPYVPGQVMPTTSTPQFNVFSNIPYGIGDESNFVRVRPSTGDPTASGDNGSRNDLYVQALNAACNVGDQYDVRTYVHNGADPDFNGNGAGTAVAHGVQVAMTAKLGQNATTFPFTSAITATNAASITDTGTLNCNSNVQLELVPSTVKAYSKTLGWQDVSTDAVNGKIKIGSRDMNSGDVWGCWDEVVLVVYTVKVVPIPTPPTPIYSCDLLSNTGKISDNKYSFSVNYTAKNGATIKDVTYVYSDGSTVTDSTTSNGVATTNHLFTDAATTKRTVTATANFTVNGETKSNTSAKCATEITATVTPTTTTPTVLPNTGAGNTIAIFTGVSFIGAFLYRMRALRSVR